MGKSKITLRWSVKKNAAQNAARELPALVEEVFRAARKVARPDSPKKPLHQFRLVVKRFRYTLELFRPCYGPALKRRLDALRALQDFLGEINDCETTLAMLKNAELAELEESVTLRDFVVARMQAKRAAFVAHWHETFDHPGEEGAWAGYFKRFAN